MTEEMIRMDLRANVTPAELRKLRGQIAPLERNKAELTVALRGVIDERNEANAKLDQALSQNEALRAQVDTYRQAEARLLERIERLENGPVVREVRG